MRKTAAELLAEADRIDAEYSALEALRAPLREFGAMVGDFAARACHGLASVGIVSIGVDAAGARELGIDGAQAIATAHGTVVLAVARAGVPVPADRSCHNCPASGGGAGFRQVRCRLAGVLALRPDSTAPDGCPLRGGPVALTLTDRGRP
jgi:hypothetical protein